MSNTLGTTNADVIAQQALKELLAQLPILRMIASDYTGEGAKFGETVIVHDVIPATAGLFVPGTGYVASERTQIDIPVKIDKHVHHTYGVSVQEASSARVDLIRRFATTGAYAIGAAIIEALCELVTAANFVNKTVKALGAGEDGFDRKAMIAVGKALSRRKVPRMDRFALLNPDYYGSLAADDKMLAVLLTGGAAAATSGELPRVHGILPQEYVDLPDNGEDLMGFAGTRTALAIATRIPDDPGEGQANVRLSTVTDVDTGISLQVREYYNSTLAEFNRSYTLMFGVAKGQVAALQRIVAK